MVNPAMAALIRNVDSGSAINARGRAIPRPKTEAEKKELGTDHLPMFADADLPAMVKLNAAPQKASKAKPTKPKAPKPKAKAKV